MNTLYISFLILTGLWRAFSDKSDNNCVKIELVDNPSNDNIITVEENKAVNLTFVKYVSSNLPREFSRYKIIRVDESTEVLLTFCVNTDVCPKNQQPCLIKLTTYDRDLVIVKCKIFIENGTCASTFVSKSCVCVHADDESDICFNEYVNFFVSEYQIYFWISTIWHLPETEKPVEVVLVVRESQTKQAADTDDAEAKCFCLGLHAVISSYVFAVVVVFGTGFIVRRKHKTRTPSFVRYGIKLFSKFKELVNLMNVFTKIYRQPIC